MKILIGRLMNERSYKTKKGFEVRELLISEEGSFMPTLVQVSPDFKVSANKAGMVEIPFAVSAWDERSGKFSSSVVKLKAISNSKELAESKE